MGCGEIFARDSVPVRYGIASTRQHIWMNRFHRYCQRVSPGSSVGRGEGRGGLAAYSCMRSHRISPHAGSTTGTNTPTPRSSPCWCIAQEEFTAPSLCSVRMAAFGLMLGRIEEVKLIPPSVSGAVCIRGRLGNRW